MHTQSMTRNIEQTIMMSYKILFVLLLIICVAGLAFLFLAPEQFPTPQPVVKQIPHDTVKP